LKTLHFVKECIIFNNVHLAVTNNMEVIIPLNLFKVFAKCDEKSNKAAFAPNITKVSKLMNRILNKRSFILIKCTLCRWL